MIKKGQDEGTIAKRRPKKLSHDARILTLNDIGINADRSSRWQKIAAIPKPLFEDFIEETKAAEKELTTAGALRLVKKASEVNV